MNKRIFIIEDDRDMRVSAAHILEREGFGVEGFENPLEALKGIRASPPDLILLDLNLPDMSGFEVCKVLKADPKIHHIPVIILSVKSDEADVVAGLEVGADDYVYKPFRKNELLARVRAMLRRQADPPPRIVESGPFRLDYSTYKAFAGSTELVLRPKEFELLGFLLRREGRVLTRQTISSEVWGVGYEKSMQTIEFHMYQLRKKLGPYGACIKGLKGVGYRFETPEDDKNR